MPKWELIIVWNTIIIAVLYLLYATFYWYFKYKKEVKKKELPFPVNVVLYEYRDDTAPIAIFVHRFPPREFSGKIRSPDIIFKEGSHYYFAIQ